MCLKIIIFETGYDNENIFGGSKRLHLQEVNQLGGSNKWLGMLFICSAVCIVLIQLAFLFLYIAKIVNKPGGAAEFYDPENLSF